MIKIDNVVKKETSYILIWSVLLSLLLQAVFLIAGVWAFPVLFGNLLGIFSAVLNFFLMGLTIQAAVLKEEADAKAAMKVSSVYRNFLLLLTAVLGILLPCFHIWATLIPLFFPRIAIALRPLCDKRRA